MSGGRRRPTSSSDRDRRRLLLETDVVVGRADDRRVRRGWCADGLVCVDVMSDVRRTAGGLRE
jgi:hypothetical protein